jgi:6-phosphogluconate dehydrogenase
MNHGIFTGISLLSIFIIRFTLQVFEDWNKGELESFLIEISRDILRFKDADGKYLLGKIRDTAGQVSGKSVLFIANQETYLT